MIKKISLVILLAASASCNQNNCPPNINKKPMFGEVAKCPEQIEADNKFLSYMDEVFEGDRESAAQDRIVRAWEYFNKENNDSAMMRFNQAWLLDSLNADIYWGYGNLLGRQQKFEESLKYFRKSLLLNPNNSTVWYSASLSYGQLFFESKDQKFLDKSIEYLKESVKLDPNNAQAYGQLAGAYSYFMQQDSARKYLEIAERLDPAAVNPEVREFLKEK